MQSIKCSKEAMSLESAIIFLQNKLDLIEFLEKRYCYDGELPSATMAKAQEMSNIEKLKLVGWFCSCCDALKDECGFPYILKYLQLSTCDIVERAAISWLRNSQCTRAEKDAFEEGYRSAYNQAK